VTLVVGLVFGLLIAAATVAAEHYGPSFDSLKLSLSGNGALSVPFVLVPLAIFWGWAWIDNRWAGRSVLPTVLYTLGLFVGVGAMGPADAALFPQGGGAPTLGVADLLGGLFQACLFVGIPAVIAAPIYWVLRTRAGANRLLIWILYLVALAISVLVPLLGIFATGGIVAGTGAGHAWQRQGARSFVAIVVIVIMLLAVFGVPIVLSSGVLPSR
jgi:hypothetical protein